MRPHFAPEVYRPRLPNEPKRFGIAFIGCGSVVRKWQLPSYRTHGLKIVGVWDKDPSAIRAAMEVDPDLRAYASLEELLDDPEVIVVDIATRVAGRTDLILRALAARKHVLAQKPVCRTTEELAALHAADAASDLHLTINLNGRWAPPWRVASRLIRDNVIGDVLAVTHLHDIKMSWLPDLERHGSHLFILFDYMVHWLDISLDWLGSRRSYTVWAHCTSHPVPSGGGLLSQVGWLSLVAEEGISVSIHSVATAKRYSGHSFIVHGTRGTVRGAVDAPMSGDFVELDDGEVIERPTLEGHWFPDGFVGSMGELLSAIEEGREPEHAFRRASRSHRLVLAACRSAEMTGQPIEVTLP